MSKQTCSICRHYKPSAELPLFGKCRANPPAGKYTLDINVCGRTLISLDLIPQTDNPVVHNSHSCGRFVSK